MDQKQFTRFQDAIQYAVDDANRQRHAQPPTAWRWLQGSWGSGRVTKRRRKQKVTGTYLAVACPTTGCVAGTIVIQAGDHLVAPLECAVGTEVTTDYCMDKTGTVHEIANRAQDLLDLDEDDLHGLFNGGMRIDDIVQTAEVIAKEQGFKLELAETVA